MFTLAACLINQERLRAEEMSQQEIERLLDDPEIEAYIWRTHIKHIVDRKSLAAAAYRAKRLASQQLAALTVVLIDVLHDDEPTPIEESAPDHMKGPRLKNQIAVDPGPPSRHDLTIAGGRAAYVLERIFDITLPPRTANDSAEAKRKIEEEAYERILSAKLQAEREIVPRLDKAERIRLAESIDTPNNILLKLIDDPDDEVIIALAKNRRPLGANLVRRMKSESDPELKRQLQDLILGSPPIFVHEPPVYLRDSCPPLRELVKQAQEATGKTHTDSTAPD